MIRRWFLRLAQYSWFLVVRLLLHPSPLFPIIFLLTHDPTGNTYFIENISQRNARLFFTQARKTINNEEETLIALQNRAKRRASRSRRSESEARGESVEGRRGESGSVGPLHGVLRDPEEEEEEEGEGEETPRVKKKKKAKA